MTTPWRHQQTPAKIANMKIATSWYLQLSRLAFVLFLAALGALLWLNDKSEHDEQRATLISDMLWLEQDMHFALNRNAEQLQTMALQLAGAGATDARFDSNARRLLVNESGLRQLMWYTADLRFRAALPPTTEAGMIGETAGTMPSRETFRLAAALGKPSYSPTYAIVDGDAQFEIHVPQFRDGQFVGMLVGTYSIRALLNQLVPWWLTERYRVSIVDIGGAVLGSKTAISGDLLGPSYQLPFEPPGHGLTLQAVAYEQKSSLARNVLAVAIVVLALAVLVSLWALRRHIQRRQAAESALRDEYAFRKAMEDSLDTGLRARDLEGRITYVNPAFCQMTGWTAEELVGLSPPMPYWLPEDIERTRAVHDNVLAGSIPSEGIELVFRRKNGEHFDALIHEAPLIDSQGRHNGWMGSVIDISERKQNEELARQQQARLQATARLVAMGEMASSLAHELNQPLAAIASYNAGVLNQIRAGDFSRDELAAALDKLGQQAQRAGQVIRRIYEFVRRSEPRRENCDFRTIVDNAVELLEPDARQHGIRIERDIAATLPPIAGDAVLLGQVLVNLLRNGIEAMAMTSTEQRILNLTVAAGYDDNGGIHLTLCDHGHGIPEAMAERLFEPFFSTKSEGMGMGLNICRSIVESHQGRLWFTANPGGGTCFHLQLRGADEK
jgi:two-component system sensor histidine kinase DctS